MKRKSLVVIFIVSTPLVVLGAKALCAQDKYSLKVPEGLAFSEFRGYEDWHIVAVSHSEALKLIDVIVANPVMIEAYRAGSPGNGKAFPDGSKMAKIHWSAVKSTDAPTPTIVPNGLHDIDLMVRDSKRFAATGGWGYAVFDYDAASDAFAPRGKGSDCGYACHSIARAKDFVFTEYQRR